MDIKKLLSLLSKQSDETLPALRKTTLPDEIPVQVLGKGKSSVNDIIEEIPDAEIIPKKVSTMDSIKKFAKENPGKIAGGLTLAEIARQMSGGNDEVPPMMTPPPTQAKLAEPEEKKSELAGKIPEQKSPAVDTSKIAEQIKQYAETPKEETPVGPTQDQLYADRLAGAQDADSQGQFMNALVRAANQAGSAIAGSKADYSGVEALEKNAGRNVANFKEHLGTKAASQNLKKAENEINDEQKLRDPNSDISKSTIAQLGKYGINVKTAMEAKQLNPQIFNLLMADRAQQNQKEIAQMNALNANEKHEDVNKFKSQQSIDRQVSQVLKSKDYESYNAAKDAQFALSNAMNSKDDKIKGGAAFMQYAKIAQGDNSVVRDGDMAQLAGRYNYTSVGDMFNKLRAQAHGGNFGSRELEQMNEVAQLTQKIKGKRVGHLISPIVKRADASGLDLSESIDPSVVEEFSKPEFGLVPEKQGSSQYTPKEEAGIANYAKAKGLSREQAISNLKAGGRIK